MTATIEQIKNILVDDKAAENGFTQSVWQEAFERFGGMDALTLEVRGFDYRPTPNGPEHRFEFSAMLNQEYDTLAVVGEVYHVRETPENVSSWEDNGRDLLGGAVLEPDRRLERTYMRAVNHVAHETALVMGYEPKGTPEDWQRQGRAIPAGAAA